MTNDLATDDRPAPSLLDRWAGILVVVAVLVGVFAVIVVARLAAEYGTAREGLPLPCVEDCRWQKLAGT